MRSRTPLFTEMHHRIEMLRSRLATLCQYLSILLRVVQRHRPSKKGEECRGILEYYARATLNRLTELLRDFLLFFFLFFLAPSSFFSPRGRGVETID